MCAGRRPARDTCRGRQASLAFADAAVLDLVQNLFDGDVERAARAHRTVGVEQLICAVARGDQRGHDRAGGRAASRVNRMPRSSVAFSAPICA